MGVERKIWKGDVLNLSAGNSFWGDEVALARAINFKLDRWIAENGARGYLA